MQIMVDIPDEMRGEAESRHLPLVDYIEMVLSEGRQAMAENTIVSSAIERIRALRASSPQQQG